MRKKYFEAELYQQIPINDLILFCMRSVAERKEKCTFERVLRECFSFFPKVFAFAGAREWPDARKIDRPLRALRNKKFIAGDPQTIFSLTKLGEKAADQVAKIFLQRKLEL